MDAEMFHYDLGTCRYYSADYLHHAVSSKRKAMLITNGEYCRLVSFKSAISEMTHIHNTVDPAKITAVALSDDLNCGIAESIPKILIYSKHGKLVSEISCDFKVKDLVFIATDRILASNRSSIMVYSLKGQLLFSSSFATWFTNQANLYIVQNDSVINVDENTELGSKLTLSLRTAELSFVFASQTGSDFNLICCSNPKIKLNSENLETSMSPLEHLHNLNVQDSGFAVVSLSNTNLKEIASVEIPELPIIDIAVYDATLKLLAITSFTSNMIIVFQINSKIITRIWTETIRCDDKNTTARVRGLAWISSKSKLLILTSYSLSSGIFRLASWKESIGYISSIQIQCLEQSNPCSDVLSSKLSKFEVMMNSMKLDLLKELSLINRRLDVIEGVLKGKIE